MRALIPWIVLAIALLSVADRIWWHSLHFPWSTYETVGTWHACNFVDAPHKDSKSALLRCAEGEVAISFEKEPLVSGGAVAEFLRNK